MTKIFALDGSKVVFDSVNFGCIAVDSMPQNGLHIALEKEVFKTLTGRDCDGDK